MNKIVLCDKRRFGQDCLPLNKQACQMLANLGVESAKEHLIRCSKPIKIIPMTSCFHEEDEEEYIRWEDYNCDLARHDKKLVSVIEQLKEFDHRLKFSIVEIESDRYQIRTNSNGEECIVLPEKWITIEKE